MKRKPGSFGKGSRRLWSIGAQAASPWCSELGPAKCGDFLFTFLPPLFPWHTPRLSKKHFESRRLCLILCKREAGSEGSRVLGLGHFGNTSHMTLSMGGPQKLTLCFFYTPPPNHPTCSSVSFSKPKKFQRPEPNTGAFLHALIFCPLSVCQWVRISPPLQPTHPKRSLEV